MDSITQGALGAACSQMLFGKRNKHIPWIGGALSGMAADLDIFIRVGGNPLSIEQWHRSFTHSLIFIPIGGLLVALCLMIFPLFRTQWKLTLAVCLVGYGTHAILDAFTTYGTMLFWPWTTQRISWDIISIVDPVFTLPLIIGTVGSVVYRKQKLLMACFGFSMCFIAFNAILHQRALNYIHYMAQQEHLDLHSIRVIPKLARSTDWRAIAKTPQCIYLADISTPLLGSTSSTPITAVRRFTPSMLTIPLSANQNNELAIFTWFSDDYLIAAQLSPLVVLDGRYTLGTSPLQGQWGIQLKEGAEHVTKVGRMTINAPCDFLN